jgi:hypothetical protein
MLTPTFLTSYFVQDPFNNLYPSFTGQYKCWKMCLGVDCHHLSNYSNIYIKNVSASTNCECEANEYIDKNKNCAPYYYMNSIKV